MGGMKYIMSESLDITGGFDELYKIFLIDCTIGPYFDEYITTAARSRDEQSKGVETNEISSILQKEDLEIMKALLKKAWLEDFFAFVMAQGGTTAEVMGGVLETEADFRVLLVMLNALHTDMSSESALQESGTPLSKGRNALFPKFGKLYPEGVDKLRKCWNSSSIEAVLEPYAEYKELFDKVKNFYDSEQEGGRGGQSIEDYVYKTNVKNYELCFEQQYHFGIFYAWVKLKEQEIRNIRFIASMVQLQRKDPIDNTIVPIFNPRGTGGN